MGTGIGNRKSGIGNSKAQRRRNLAARSTLPVLPIPGAEHAP